MNSSSSKMWVWTLKMSKKLQGDQRYCCFLCHKKSKNGTCQLWQRSANILATLLHYFSDNSRMDETTEKPKISSESYINYQHFDDDKMRENRFEGSN